MNMVRQGAFHPQEGQLSFAWAPVQGSAPEWHHVTHEFEQQVYRTTCNLAHQFELHTGSVAS